MPYSDPAFDSKIKSFIRSYKFSQYLDIGSGAGKYGKIIKDIYPSARIVSLEPDKSYVKKFKLKKIYDKVIIKKAEEYLLTKPNYSTEVCIIGDCIEHLKKSDGIDLINYLIYRTHYIIIVFPTKFLQFSYENHDLEAHISTWSEEDFRGFNYEYSKKRFMNLVIIKGFLGDAEAIGKNKHNLLTKFLSTFLGKTIHNKAFT